MAHCWAVKELSAGIASSTRRMLVADGGGKQSSWKSSALTDRVPRPVMATGASEGGGSAGTPDGCNGDGNEDGSAGVGWGPSGPIPERNAMRQIIMSVMDVMAIVIVR